MDFLRVDLSTCFGTGRLNQWVLMETLMPPEGTGSLIWKGDKGQTTHRVT